MGSWGLQSSAPLRNFVGPDGIWAWIWASLDLMVGPAGEYLKTTESAISKEKEAPAGTTPAGEYLKIPESAILKEKKAPAGTTPAGEYLKIPESAILR